MKYSIKDFQKQFPNDEACLAYIFAKKYPNATQFYPVKGRKAYANPQGEQVYPLKGTIFEKTSTPLTLWFYAIYLFSASKNGVSAMELQRQLGITYKTAWRMAYNIRRLMEQDAKKLSGIVEIDETYIGGERKGKRFSGGSGKAILLGYVKRGGDVKTDKVEARQTHIVLKAVQKNVQKGSWLMTDQFGVYRKTNRMGYRQLAVNHWRKEFVRGAVHTNTIEGFWSQLKRSMSGTYHSVSAKHLQRYADEFAFRYNLRASPLPIFDSLLAKI